MTSCVKCACFPGVSKICFGCKSHLCKSVASKTNNTNLCVTCLKIGSKHQILKRDKKGRLLDPVTNKSMPTCVCGDAIWDLCPCYYKMMQGYNNHGYLR